MVLVFYAVALESFFVCSFWLGSEFVLLGRFRVQRLFPLLEMSRKRCLQEPRVRIEPQRECFCPRAQTAS